ncbi:MAG: N-acetylmuramoyl-L-alanine amidase [Muribaculum sp.]|nr:N-acetylmuramoyl-L-alanine amidase [Muribaculum sp.]
MKFKSLIYNIIVILLVMIFPFALSARDANGKFVIAIDAGHGGHDTGACDNGAREKDINLGVSLKLGEMIEKNMKDVKVIYTRSNDTFKSLQERADIANKGKADLFVSVHTNSLDKNNKNRSSVEGASVYALGLHKDANNMDVARRENSVIELESDYQQKYQGFDPNKDESYIIFEMAQKKNLSKSLNFAKEVQRELSTTAGRKNRGVHQAGFWVLWATSMPAVLIELDFICNPTSARFMTGSDGQTKLAKGIFNAVKDYVAHNSAPSSKLQNNKSKTVTTDETHNASGKSSGSSKVSGKDRKNRKSSKKKSDTALEVKPTESKEIIASVGIPLLPAVTREEKKTHKTVAQTNAGNGKRRRRSQTARKVSEQKIAQSANISLHTESEREIAMVMSDPSISQEEPASVSSAPKDNKRPKASKKPKAKSSKSRHKSKVQKFQTIYSIQVLTSNEQLAQSDPRFHGLSPLSMFRENNMYKYTYGEHKSREAAEGELKKIRTDFPDARIIEAKRIADSSRN